MVVHGNMIRKMAGRADLHLYIDNVKRDTSLTFSSSPQWEDASVFWSGYLPPGDHIAWVQSPQPNVWGCQGGWGELDVLDLPAEKGMVTYSVPDRTGKMKQCPPPSKANSRLIQKKFTLKTDSVVMVHGSMIRLKKGRADLYLYVDGQRRDITLTYTGSKQWDDGTVYWHGLLRRGTHTIWMQSPVANVWGCQWPDEMWGNLDVLVIPAMRQLQIHTAKDTRKGCPAKSKAGQPLVKTVFTIATESIVVVHGNLIRNMKGRADLQLKVDGRLVDMTLTYTSSKQWEDAAVFWTGKLPKGKHTAMVTSGQANVWGCSKEWGDLSVLTMPTAPIGALVTECAVNSANDKPSSLVFDLHARDWNINSRVWKSRVNGDKLMALGHGGDVIKVFKNGAYSVRLDSSDDNFLFPLDVGPGKMPKATFEIWVWLDKVTPDSFGWLLGAENGGCDRYIILHDKRIGGTGPSCKNGNWGLGNTPAGQWSHLAAVYVQNGPSYIFLNGKKSGIHNTKHDGHPAFLMLGAPYKTGHLANVHVASARVYNDVLSDAEIIAHSRSPPGQYCQRSSGH